MKKTLLMVCLSLSLMVVLAQGAWSKELPRAMELHITDDGGGGVIGGGNSGGGGTAPADQWFGGTQQWGLSGVVIKHAAVVFGIFTIKSQATSSPGPGWKMIDVDLNKGAGGDYIYMHVLYGWTTTPITDLGVAYVENGRMNYPALSWYELINVNLNRNAGGSMLYLCTSLAPGSAVTNVVVLDGKKASDAKAQKPAGAWKIVDVDLNKGAGGRYLYFCYVK